VTRWASSLCGIVLTIVALGCGGDGVTPEARRELAALERAFGALESAHPEDRGIRLQEVEQLTGADARVAKLKALCIASYRGFAEANELLAEARAKTKRAEAAIIGAGGSMDGGAPLGVAEREELVEASGDARKSLAAVNISLDRAEKLIKACEQQRASLRESFARP